MLCMLWFSWHYLVASFSFLLDWEISNYIKYDGVRCHNIYTEVHESYFDITELLEGKPTVTFFVSLSSVHGMTDSNKFINKYLQPPFPPEDGNRSCARNFVICPEYQTMDKVQKPSNTNCNITPRETVRLHVAAEC
jgi:hypothetical protein